MKKITFLAISINILFFPLNYMFANDNSMSCPDIVRHITEGGSCTIEQPEALNRRLLKKVETTDSLSGQTEKRMAGYRIQVFSDNNIRTAKNEARTKEREILERFPEYRTYVIYNSPFWRLRVGDFPTIEAANDVAVEIKEAFPAYRREIRVVRDRINCTE